MPTPGPYEFDSLLSDNAIPIRDERTVALGPINLHIRSNEPEFSGFRYFPIQHATRAASAERQDYVVTLCNLGIDGPWAIDALLRLQDDTYRAKRFNLGYYITDHFGDPAYLVTRDNRIWVFAHALEPILWPYLVKLLLTCYSTSHHALHLKASAIAIDGVGTLLVARGGGGKTVLLSQLCLNGAAFLSNTHVLARDRTLIGVPTTMRVRPASFFQPIVANGALHSALKPGEYLVDPVSDLGWRLQDSAPLKNICLVDFRGVDHHVIRESSARVIYDYMEQFSLALNVYGLKEDVLDAAGIDPDRFSQVTRTMKSGLLALVRSARLFVLSMDAENRSDLERLMRQLST